MSYDTRDMYMLSYREICMSYYGVITHEAIIQGIYMRGCRARNMIWSYHRRVYSESPNGNIYEMCNSCVGSLWLNLIVQETFLHSD